MYRSVQSEEASFKEQHWVYGAKFLVDVIALQVALYLGWFTRSFLTRWFPLDMSQQDYGKLAIGLLLLPVGLWLVRLYPGYGLTSVERLRRRLRTTFIFFMVFITWNFLLHESGRSRGVLLFTFCVALVLPPFFQMLFRKILIRFDLWGTPVIVLGAGMTGEHVINSLLKEPVLGYRPIALFDDDRAKWGSSIAGVPIVGNLSKADEYSDKVNFALIAIPGAGRERVVDLARHLPFFNVIIVPDLIGLQSLWVETRDLGGVIGLEIQKNLLLRRNWYLKRMLDYMLGVPLFVVSVPILILFSFWTMLMSPGNPFYCQVREGRRGRKFKVWKMRTMFPHAEKLLHDYLENNPDAKQEWGQFFKLKNDPRILPVIGTLLRKTSLDELPQLWNVLRGEMSLVGPRPFPHYHLEQFDESFREIRRSVMPGMTGLWQVNARSDGNLTVQETLDSYYIRNWSFWLDLSLLARTISVVVSGKGAY
jgi:Undecaprenyl-phosphate galactose phosphotransferase WbaP